VELRKLLLPTELLAGKAEGIVAVMRPGTALLGRSRGFILIHHVVEMLQGLLNR
jgi:hypothetical protein